MEYKHKSKTHHIEGCSSAIIYHRSDKLQFQRFAEIILESS